MIRAIAIDDEPLPLEILQAYCDKTELVSLERTFTKIVEAQKYLRKFPVDLLFLDIHMPKMSGIEFYKSIEQSTMVIFTTAHSQYALEGFNLNAVDFLLKPFSFERFESAVIKANEYYNYQNHKETAKPQHIYVRADYSLIKIAFPEIHYIESLGDYICIYLDNGKRITTRMTMKTVYEKLSAKDFIRVHRSFIVPIKGIENIKGKTMIVYGKEIPIGNLYEEDVLKLIK
jgi:hypothetical protein